MNGNVGRFLGMPAFLATRWPRRSSESRTCVWPMPLPRQFLQPYISAFAPHRVFVYSIISSAALLAVIANALRNHSNFYAVAVFLSKSNGTVLVLANFCFVITIILGRLLQQIFFGPLRSQEVERLYDRMCFALMFGVLLFTKCFHWLLSDRIEWVCYS
ncbi:hypothetical protein BD410DRAFT_111888 [Rickenella mellea]|uniref:E3 ubiquitin-protein ligase synoviolin-like TPR repeats domain-containing protein n=1 Tax=Rickenella mellea TaxID=50990 RepID=A0A4Y7Q949_9AGAM|nr:hypothetical protein BD410DRAFT_111888 [Rickenella mellea]